MDGMVGALMARKRGQRPRPPGDVEAAKLADLGPAVRLQGDREGPGRTQEGYRPDPDNPKRLVYGAQASPPHHRLLLDRRITVWQYEAGARFAAYWHVREYGHTPDPNAPRARRAPGDRSGGMSFDQALASQRLAQAREALGPLAEIAVKAVCVAELPLYRAFEHVFPHLAGGTGPSQPVRAAVMQGMLVVALDVLARRWRLGPRRPGRPRALPRSRAGADHA
jgi:hypothetical protein